MVLIGLLLVALACLIVGLIMANAVWLIGSLVASAVAGYLLFKQREQLAVRAGTSKDQAAPKTTRRSDRSDTARQCRAASAVAGNRLGVQRPAPAESAPASRPSPKPAPAPAAPTANPEQQVWVVDTLPQFHTRGLRRHPEPRFRGDPVRAGGGRRLHRVHRVQAGPVGEPDRTGVGRRRPSRLPPRGLPQPEGRRVPAGKRAPTRFRAPRPSRTASHRAPTAVRTAPPRPTPRPGLRRRAAEPEPAEEPAEEPAATPDTVWVVDGRPRYHLGDCMIIKDQDAEEIPLAQATEDGFMACSMCQPAVQTA